MTLTSIDPDQLAESMTHVAHRLAVAVDDHDPDRVTATIGDLDTLQLRALAVVLAAHLDPDVLVYATRPGGDVDPVLVDRLLGGEWQLSQTATNAERHIVVNAWREQGRPSNELARLTGWRINRYTNRIAKCGTDAGYYRHKRVTKDDACEPCRMAHRDAERARETAKRTRAETAA